MSVSEIQNPLLGGAIDWQGLEKVLPKRHTPKSQNLVASNLMRMATAYDKGGVEAIKTTLSEIQAEMETFRAQESASPSEKA